MTYTWEDLDKELYVELDTKRPFGQLLLCHKGETILGVSLDTGLEKITVSEAYKLAKENHYTFEVDESTKYKLPYLASYELYKKLGVKDTWTWDLAVYCYVHGVKPESEVEYASAFAIEHATDILGAPTVKDEKLFFGVSKKELMNDSLVKLIALK